MSDLRTVSPSSSNRPDAESTTKARTGTFRPDVEGLRTVAIGTVLLYHAGIGLVPGGFIGVDVFFVISGFLITGLLLRELARDGTISLTRFYARRAKRLLPATGVVLVATVLLTRALLPPIQWGSIGGDIIAAAGYVVNWRLAANAVNYLNEGQAVSPVQQFWSLAVEEQFYLLWPLLLLVAAWWFRRFRGGRIGTGPLWVGLAAIALPSLAWSVYQTQANPKAAFFVTTTRMWELAVGAALAIGATHLHRLPRALAALLGWVGLAAVGGAALTVTASDPWPGYLALVPTLGTAAVIAAGPAAGAVGPAAILGTRPFVWVGGLSYSLYLWHWPIVIVATERLGGNLTGAQGLAVIAASFVPAYLSLRLVENPFRHWPRLSRSPRWALLIGAGFTVIGIVAGLGLRAAVPHLGVPAGSPRAETALGAAALGDNPRTSPAGRAVDRVKWITPDPLEATKDLPVAYADGCQQTASGTAPKKCEYGVPDGTRTVALVGDSKILQWLPALQEIAKQERWKLVTYTKSACPFASVLIGGGGGPYTTCRTWNQAVLEALVADPPDVVLTSTVKRGALVSPTPSPTTSLPTTSSPATPAPNPSSNASGGAPPDRRVLALADGMRQSWAAVTDAGSRVIVLLDTPSPPIDVYACVAENVDSLGRCSFGRAAAMKASSAGTLRLAVERFPSATLIDLTDDICPQERCSPVIGNVLVYRQGSHVTATYIKTLAPRLRTALIAAIDREKRN